MARKNTSSSLLRKVSTAAVAFFQKKRRSIGEEQDDSNDGSSSQAGYQEQFAFKNGHFNPNKRVRPSRAGSLGFTQFAEANGQILDAAADGKDDETKKRISIMRDRITHDDFDETLSDTYFEVGEGRPHRQSVYSLTPSVDYNEFDEEEPSRPTPPEGHIPNIIDIDEPPMVSHIPDGPGSYSTRAATPPNIDPVLATPLYRPQVTPPSRLEPLPPLERPPVTIDPPNRTPAGKPRVTQEGYGTPIERKFDRPTDVDENSLVTYAPKRSGEPRSDHMHRSPDNETGVGLPKPTPTINLPPDYNDSFRKRPNEDPNADYDNTEPMTGIPAVVYRPGGSSKTDPVSRPAGGVNRTPQGKVNGIAVPPADYSDDSRGSQAKHREGIEMSLFSPPPEYQDVPPIDY